jgi:hypothetical protein
VAVAEAPATECRSCAAVRAGAGEEIASARATDAPATKANAAAASKGAILDRRCIDSPIPTIPLGSYRADTKYPGPGARFQDADQEFIVDPIYSASASYGLILEDFDDLLGRRK